MIKILLAIIILFSSCNSTDRNSWSDTKQSYHETVYDGNDSIVFIHYYDPYGVSHDIYLPYLLFWQIYRSSGYAGCYNYSQNYQPVSNFNNYKSRQPYYKNKSSNYVAPVVTPSAPRSYTPSYKEPVKTMSPPPTYKPTPVYKAPVRTPSPPVQRAPVKTPSAPHH